MFDLILEKEFTETNYKRFQEALIYLKHNLIDTNGSMYLTVDSLMEINNIITGSNNIALRKVNVKRYGFDKMYMDKELIRDKPYQIIDHFNERQITSTKFYSIVLNKIKRRACKILFATNHIIRHDVETNSGYV